MVNKANVLKYMTDARDLVKDHGVAVALSGNLMGVLLAGLNAAINGLGEAHSGVPTGILDKLGREITVGDYIAYGHALGRCAGLRIGKVLKVNTERPFRNGESVKHKEFGTCYINKVGETTLRVSGSIGGAWVNDSIIPIEEFEHEHSISITVIGLNDDWEHNSPELCKSTGTLLFPNRILVLDPEDIPLEKKSLLDGFSMVK